MKYITIDNVEYRVRVEYKSLSRSFSIVEGTNSGTSIKARTIRDIIGTGYTYQMNIEPDPRYPNDYDNFYYAISAPTESHIVALPFGQDTIEFEAYITSGSDTYNGKSGGFERWSGLTVTFEPIEPQRTI